MSHSSRPYHHGDLVNQLIDLATQSVQEKGVEGLSLRKVAGAAGVSHTAVYGHFPTKAALLAAVLVQGYERLRALLEKKTRRADDPPTQLQMVALAYLQFCRDEPNVFFAMCGPRLAVGGDFPDLEQALADAFRFIEAPISAVKQDLPLGEVTAVAYWSGLQGFLSQLLTGRVRMSPKQEKAFVAAFSDGLCRGFGII